jgi:hypothetical protein
MVGLSSRSLCRAGIGAAALIPLWVAAGCNSSTGGGTSKSPGGSGGELAAHEDVVLRDVLGVALTPGSDRPYSPRETCGGCHPIDEIANGYHFQQGRTDAAGLIVTQDDFFGHGTAYVRSPGMYGKW